MSVIFMILQFPPIAIWGPPVYACYFECVWLGCRADITGILLCTSQLLLYSCDSMSQLLDPCDADTGVHNYCCCLLAALAVIAAPLESLYRLILHCLLHKSLTLESLYRLILHCLLHKSLTLESLYRLILHRLLHSSLCTG